MMRLNLNELHVTSYETDPGDGTVEPGDDTTVDTTTTDEEAVRTHPRVCAYSRYWWCVTYQVGCQSGGGAVC